MFFSSFIDKDKNHQAYYKKKQVWIDVLFDFLFYGKYIHKRLSIFPIR
jgi:hypothetical protein